MSGVLELEQEDACLQEVCVIGSVIASESLDSLSMPSYTGYNQHAPVASYGPNNHKKKQWPQDFGNIPGLAAIVLIQSTIFQFAMLYARRICRIFANGYSDLISGQSSYVMIMSGPGMLVYRLFNTWASLA